MSEEKRKLDECVMEEFGRLESSDKTIAILGDRWWPQTLKQDRDKTSKSFYVLYGKRVASAPHVGGDAIWSKNGVALSRKG